MKLAMKTLLTTLIALWVSSVLAQQLEIIPLKSKTAEQVLPVLQPLLEAGATLSGMDNQLFLRTSVKNREEIKRVLAAIDLPSRRLIIRIAQNRQSEDNTRGAAVQGQVVLGSTTRHDAHAQVWDTRSARSEQAGQMVQTIDGGRAFIRIGRSLPIPMRQILLAPGGVVQTESVVYRDIGSGFYATPRVNGGRVTLDISQQAENGNLGQIRPGIATQQLTTTVSGRLGEWIELGGTGQQASAEQGGTFSVGTADVRDKRSIWLKVEEVE